VHLVWIGLGTAEPNPFPDSIKAFRESLDKGGTTISRTTAAGVSPLRRGA
jgi:hypothetical protein